MFSMFKQIFLAVSALFIGLEKWANAFNHLATWGEEAAGAFADEARINRKAQMKALRAEKGITEAEVPDQAPLALPE